MNETTLEATPEFKAKFFLFKFLFEVKTLMGGISLNQNQDETVDAMAVTLSESICNYAAVAYLALKEEVLKDPLCQVEPFKQTLDIILKVEEEQNGKKETN